MYNVVYIFGHIENASTFRFIAGAVTIITIIVILIGSYVYRRTKFHDQ